MLALPFSLEPVLGVVKVIISKEGVGEDGVPKRDEGGRSFIFSFIKLAFLRPRSKLRQRLVLEALHTGIFIFVVPGSHFYKRESQKTKFL